MTEDIPNGERLVRLEERTKTQDARLSKIENTVERIETKLTDVATDVKAARKAGAWLMAAALAVGGLFGAVGSWLTHKGGPH